ncbi:hypothetical protein O371_02751, partial [Staphylococcus aureus M0207]
YHPKIATKILIKKLNIINLSDYIILNI